MRRTHAHSALLLLVACVLSPAAYAEFAFYQYGASEFSVAVGSSLTLPDVYVAAPPGLNLSVGFEVIGGCAVFGASPSIQVPVSQSSTLGPPGDVTYAGLGPTLRATNAGACTVHLTFQDQQLNIPLHVYDHASLQLAPLQDRLMLESGHFTEDAVFRVVDSAGNSASGVRVHYEMDPTCALIGETEAYRDSRTDADGIARIPAVRALDKTGPCVERGTLIDTVAQPAEITLMVYGPDQVVVDATPTTIESFTGESFTFSIRVHLQDGTPASSLPVAARASSSASGSGTVDGLLRATTDGDGAASFTMTANATAGRYDLVVGAADRDSRFPVVQSIRGQAPPPALSPVSSSVQDMWWGGPSESGWGLAVIQHGDTLFTVIYGYGANFSGQPSWLVMPGGSWDSTHTRYSGLLYLPFASPFYAYDTSHFHAGSANGTATLVFSDADHAILDFTTFGDTQSGAVHRKEITRQAFDGPPSPVSDVGDLWWGGTAQNGWGISIVQHAGTLFAAWYTYDDNSLATWMVMPGGSWTSADTYEGRIYTTTAGAAWPDGFNPQSVTTHDAGPYRLKFTSASTATLDYTVNGHTGTLALQRQPY